MGISSRQVCIPSHFSRCRVDLPWRALTYPLYAVRAVETNANGHSASLLQMGKRRSARRRREISPRSATSDAMSRCRGLREEGHTGSASSLSAYESVDGRCSLEERLALGVLRRGEAEERFVFDLMYRLAAGAACISAEIRREVGMQVQGSM
jgi:hypothetical protein